MRTRPWAALAAAVTLGATAQAAPITLTEVVNTTTSNQGSAVSDGLNDAFDGSFILQNVLPTGVTFSRRVDTLQDIFSYRVLDSFTNTTGAAITITLDYYTNLGSDGLEAVVREGPGQSVSYQTPLVIGNGCCGFDPVVAFTYGEGMGDVVPGAFDLAYTLTIGAGETLSFLQFATLIADDTDRSGDVGAAIAISDMLLGSPDLRGLSSAQIASIANFSGVPLPGGAVFMASGLGLLAFRRRRRPC